MNVKWKLPDGTVREQTVSDVEQLMLLLRMTGSAAIEGTTYRVTESAVVVDRDEWSVSVTLER